MRLYVLALFVGMLANGKEPEPPGLPITPGVYWFSGTRTYVLDRAVAGRGKEVGPARLAPKVPMVPRRYALTYPNEHARVVLRGPRPILWIRGKVLHPAEECTLVRLRIANGHRAAPLVGTRGESDFGAREHWHLFGVQMSTGLIYVVPQQNLMPGEYLLTTPIGEYEFRVE